MPRCVHRIQELDEQVEGVEGRVALEQKYRDEMQIEEDPMKTDANAHVKEVLAAVRATITSQWEGPDRVVIEQIGNALQSDTDADVDVLADDQVIDTR